MTTRSRRRNRTGGSPRALRVLAQTEVAEEESLINLEVELSYSAGMAASAGALAWTLHDYGRQTGFEDIWQLLLGALTVSLMEVFALGLALHLLYRGAWLAVRIFRRAQGDNLSPHDLKMAHYERSLSALDRACAASFYYSFYYAYRWGQLLVLLASAIACGASQPWLWFPGRVILFLAMVFLGGRLMAWIVDWPWMQGAVYRLIRLSEDTERLLGIWWVVPPVRHAKWTTLRYWFFSAVATVTLFYSNMVGMYHPTFTVEKDVYSRSSDSVAVLTFHQGGLRGDLQGRQEWDVQASFDPLPRFTKLKLNHYVSIVELASLSDGVHWVEAELSVSQENRTEASNDVLSLQAPSIKVRFVVLP